MGQRKQNSQKRRKQKKGGSTKKERRQKKEATTQKQNHMKTAFTLALVLGTGFAANLRTSTNEALQTEVAVAAKQQGQQTVVQRLAEKYDCHAASGDLVETVEKIVEKNSEEKIRLDGECDDMVAKYARQRDEAETTFTTAFDKVVPEETVVEETKVTEANTNFDEKEAEWCVKGE
jgi:hypothetical protein